VESILPAFTVTPRLLTIRKFTAAVGSFTVINPKDGFGDISIISLTPKQLGLITFEKDDLPSMSTWRMRYEASEKE